MQRIDLQQKRFYMRNSIKNLALMSLFTGMTCLSGLQAATVAQAQQSIDSIARHAVSVCYTAYEPLADQAIVQVANRFAGGSGLSSSACQNARASCVTAFAEAIINQVGTLTSGMSHDDKQIFWSSVGTEVKLLMNTYSQSCPGGKSRYSPDHIDNLIKMKKLFG